MPAAFRVVPGRMPACPACSIVGTGDLSVVSQPYWALSPRLSNQKGADWYRISGCAHAKVLYTDAIEDRDAATPKWQDEAVRLLAVTAQERVWSETYVARIAKGVGMVPVQDLPPVMACPKCANVLYAERFRPIIAALSDGRWEISAAPACQHIPRGESCRAATAETLATRWNAWAVKKLAERLMTDEFEEGYKAAFTVAVSAR